MLDFKATRPGLKDITIDSFDAYWADFIGRPWTECLNSQTQLDILIDEAQILYSGADFFWQYVKKQQQAAICNFNVRMLLLSMYDDHPDATTATPVKFNEALGLDDLRLPRSEFDELVTNFTVINNIPITIPPAVCDVIFNMTMGHPGLVRHTLRLLWDKHRRDFSSTSAMLRYLTSSEYFRAVMDTRAFIWLDNLRSQMTKDDFVFL
ncbi:hypothetical protein BC937DRAFT_88980, partial [Endogone sp. FLAS-F59071]